MSEPSHEYAFVTQCLPGAQFKCKLLQRNGFPTCVCQLSSHQKMKVAIGVGFILLVDPTDYDRDDKGTGDIIEVVHDAKEIKRLRKSKIIPEEEDMPALPNKSHHHSKREKRLHTDRVAADDEDVEERNRVAPEQQPRPNFGDDDVEGDGDLEAANDVEAESLADKVARGGRLTKAEKRAAKHEAQEMVTEDKLLKRVLDDAAADEEDADLDAL